MEVNKSSNDDWMVRENPSGNRGAIGRWIGISNSDMGESLIATGKRI